MESYPGSAVGAGRCVRRAGGGCARRGGARRGGVRKGAGGGGSEGGVELWNPGTSRRKLEEFPAGGSRSLTAGVRCGLARLPGSGSG